MSHSGQTKLRRRNSRNPLLDILDDSRNLSLTDESRGTLNISGIAPELVKELSQAHGAAAACLAASLAATVTGISAALVALVMTAPVAITMAASYREESTADQTEGQNQKGTQDSEIGHGYPRNRGTLGHPTPEPRGPIWDDGTTWKVPWDSASGPTDGPVTDSTHACTMQTLGVMGYK